jgi:glucose/arabinose dehydrogenase
MRRTAVLVLVALVACTQQTTSTTGATETTAPAPASTTSPAPDTTGPTASTTTTAPPTTEGLAYEEVARLEFPVQIVARPGDEVSYVVVKSGRILAMQDGVVSTDPVLDISSLVRNEGERGLLSMALSPEPGFMYVHYSANADGDTMVSEFEMTGPLEVDPDSERLLLRLDQPASNHNGGMIQLVDGTLYVGLGDGGGANDEFGNGQNPNTFLGGLVALSVTGDPNPVPFSYGLRNPWRFHIEDGLIYVADVGQGSWEEVSVVPLEEGTNFGWSITEGMHCFDPPTGCDSTGTVVPVIEIAHGDAGTCSITGGPVYHGSAMPDLDGTYFYSDYCGGYLRSFRYEDGEAVDQTDWTEDVGVAGSVVGFGVDGEGEMYVLTTSAVLRVVPAG